MTKSTKKQKGIALFTALIITGIVVSLAATILYRQQIQIRLSSNINNLEQNYLFVNGLEAFAGSRLKESLKKHPQYEYLDDETWYSEEGITIPSEEAFLFAKLSDLHARINLNSLNRPQVQINTQPQNNTSNTTQTTTTGTRATSTQPSPQFIDIAQITRGRLIRLLDQIDPDQEMGSPDNFTDVIKDWIDDDNTSGNREPRGAGSGNGAESPYYQSLDKPYYSAGTEFINPTELRLLKDINEDIYQELIKHISLLPIENTQGPIETPINVNTANLEVLNSLGFSPSESQDIIDTRTDTPFITISNLQNLPSLANSFYSESTNPNGVRLEEIGVTSRYFLLEGRVEINNTRIFVNSILERQNGQVSVIMRDFSNPKTINSAVN